MTDQIEAPPAGGQADDAGSTAKPWYEGADQDTVGYIQNKKWDAETPLKVVESYRNLEKFHGVPAEQIIKLPKEADSADWGNVYSRLGRPESPEKYGTDGLKLPEGSTINDEIVSSFDKVFFDKGLTTSQRNAIIEKYAAFEAEANKAQETARKQLVAEQTTALKKEWGAHFDERIALSKQAARVMFPDAEQRDAAMDAIEYAIGPAVVAKMFANLADKIGEDKIHDGAGEGSRSFGYTKEQAVNDRNVLMTELKSSPERLAMYNKGLGTDIEKLERLNKIIAGG